MSLTNVKKKLYRENPEAIFLMVKSGIAYYDTQFKDGTVLDFEVPVNDMGEAAYMGRMDSKLLIRWIAKHF